MNGQRAPFSGPSESQPQESAMTIKIAVVGSGTVRMSAIEHQEKRELGVGYTVVDLRHAVVAARYRCRLGVEALQPVAHACLGVAIVPHNVQQRLRVSADFMHRRQENSRRR